MEQSTNYGTLDDGYWYGPCETLCRTCKHIKSFTRHTCSAFPGELPKDYWNKIKKCPKWEPEEPTDQ